MKSIFKMAVLATVLATGITAVNAEQAVNLQAIQSAKTVTVKQALMMQDDRDVRLKGYVVKALGDEKYQFRDATGTVTVDIDDDLWNGKKISAKTPVTLVGEVDVDHYPRKKVEIDVDHVIF